MEYCNCPKHIKINPDGTCVKCSLPSWKPEKVEKPVVKIDQVIEKFNALDSGIKLVKESGGIARITSTDKFIMPNSKVIVSDAFYDAISIISKELGVYLILNSMQTTVSIDKE